uniref:Histone acetyltransferase p300 n=1 Tax=Anthurium amnicola TaxID=1678845 RepID=A0A1D1YR45_9ARAE
MPRPGPRPYECVKRAWHSDRHQPVRGSLIREIFRVANEVHCPATRKNKEWQEKLPSVVLKAEEIMYSKANSEAEYVDLSTLWERANDAIDTIIRRDDSDESGNLLQPCIEAALTLGCIPRRASRSQRHSNPRCYLSSSAQEAIKPSTSSHNVLNGNRSQLGPAPYLLQPSMLACSGNLQSCSTQCTSWFSTTACIPALANGCYTEMRSANVAPPIYQIDPVSVSCSASPFGSDDKPFYKQDNALLGTSERATFGCVYPLYYSPITQNTESCSSFLEPLGSSCNGATFGSVPYGSSVKELDVQISPGSDDGNNTLNEMSNVRVASESAANLECDLSLRLGLPSMVSLAADEGWAPEVEDMGSSSSLDGSKFHELSQNQATAINFGCSFSSPQNHRGSFFLHMEGPSEPLESCSSKRSLEDEDTIYVETSDKKPRVLHDDSFDCRFSRWKQIPHGGQQFYRSHGPDS